MSTDILGYQHSNEGCRSKYPALDFCTDHGQPRVSRTCPILSCTHLAGGGDAVDRLDRRRRIKYSFCPCLRQTARSATASGGRRPPLPSLARPSRPHPVPTATSPDVTAASAGDSMSFWPVSLPCVHYGTAAAMPSQPLALRRPLPTGRPLPKPGRCWDLPLESAPRLAVLVAQAARG